MLGYVAIFLLMTIEGDLFLFTAAFLTHLGFFEPLTMFLTVLSGVTVGDLAWYWLGLRLQSHGGVRIGRWAQKLAAPFDDHLRSRTFHTIFLSKFIYGLHHAILVRAGMLGMKLDRYVKIDFVSNIFWILVIGGLGFVSSLSFDRIRHQIKLVEVVILLMLCAFVLVSYLVSYTAKKKL